MKLPAVDCFEKAESLLHATASATAEGLTDFGDQSYLTGLRVLLRALDRDMHFCDGGRENAFGVMLQALVARLYTERGWKDYPEAKQLALNKPLVITGIPRSGTTALHRLLAVDPQFQGLNHWLTTSPLPRPPLSSWSANPHYQASEMALAQWQQLVPAMKQQHLVQVGEVDECLEVLMQDFVSNRFGATLAVPSYDAWWRKQSELPSYRRFTDTLRLIGSNDPEKTWLLKNPGHTWGARELLAVLPDACVVQTHRNPVEAIPSTASTMYTARVVFEGAAADASALGQREAQLWRDSLDRMSESRARTPERFHDVRFADFVADPLRIIRSIYDRFGFELTDETEARMQQWVQDHPRHEHGRHEFTAEQFGLTERGLRCQYRDYIEQFDLG